MVIQTILCLFESRLAKADVLRIAMVGPRPHTTMLTMPLVERVLRQGCSEMGLIRLHY